MNCAFGRRPYDVIVYYVLRIAVYLRFIFIGASGTLRPTRVAEKFSADLQYLTVAVYIYGFGIRF